MENCLLRDKHCSLSERKRLKINCLAPAVMLTGAPRITHYGFLRIVVQFLSVRAIEPEHKDVKSTQCRFPKLAVFTALTVALCDALDFSLII